MTPSRAPRSWSDALARIAEQLPAAVLVAIVVLKLSGDNSAAMERLAVRLETAIARLSDDIRRTDRLAERHVTPPR